MIYWLSQLVCENLTLTKIDNNWQLVSLDILWYPLFGPTLLDSSRGPGGGRSAHPWIIAIGWQFYYFFLDRVLALDVKGQNLTAQPSTFKTVAPRLFWKITFFWQKSKFFEYLLFEKQTVYRQNVLFPNSEFFIFGCAFRFWPFTSKARTPA